MGVRIPTPQGAHQCITGSLVSFADSSKTPPHFSIAPPSSPSAGCRPGKWRNLFFFDPVTTIHVFLVQILHGNTAIRHLPHLTDVRSPPRRTAHPVPLAVEGFPCVGPEHADLLHTATGDTGRWLGHRVFVVDGSAFSMPDTPELQASARPPSSGPAVASPSPTSSLSSTSARECSWRS